MMLKSTFELFDRDGGGDIATPEVCVCVCVCGVPTGPPDWESGVPSPGFFVWRNAVPSMHTWHGVFCATLGVASWPGRIPCFGAVSRCLNSQGV